MYDILSTGGNLGPLVDERTAGHQKTLSYGDHDYSEQISWKSNLF